MPLQPICSSCSKNKRLRRAPNIQNLITGKFTCGLMTPTHCSCDQGAHASPELTRSSPRLIQLLVQAQSFLRMVIHPAVTTLAAAHVAGSNVPALPHYRMVILLPGGKQPIVMTHVLGICNHTRDPPACRGPVSMIIRTMKRAVMATASRITIPFQNSSQDARSPLLLLPACCRFAWLLWLCWTPSARPGSFSLEAGLRPCCCCCCCCCWAGSSSCAAPGLLRMPVAPSGGALLGPSASIMAAWLSRML